VEVLIIVLLLLLSAALAFRLILLQLGIKKTAKEVRSVNGNARLRMSAPEKSMEELLTAINSLLELRQNEQTESAAKELALRRQIANVSHDLRTPLTSILGYLQLLDSAALSQQERQEYLQIVKERAKSLQELITAFYDLSRLEGGNYPLVREPVSLYTVLTGILADYYSDFELSGLETEVELAENLPSVLADSNGTVRIFSNLIGNALKYSRKHFSVTLKQTDAGQLTTFANDHTGLTTEDIGHVFERFYTADQTRTSQSTGLGLAIVKALCDQMGAKIWAELKGDLFVISVLWN
jgi:signal transduction histidine kinase